MALSRGWKWALGITGVVITLKVLNDSKRFRAALSAAQANGNPTNQVGGNLLPKPFAHEASSEPAPANGDGNTLADTNPFTEYDESYFS